MHRLRIVVAIAALLQVASLREAIAIDPQASKPAESPPQVRKGSKPPDAPRQQSRASAPRPEEEQAQEVSPSTYLVLWDTDEIATFSRLRDRSVQANGTVRLWETRVRRDEKEFWGQKAKYSINLDQYNCADKSVVTLQYSVHTKDGSLISSWNPDSDLDYVMPGTNGEVSLRFACGAPFGLSGMLRVPESLSEPKFLAAYADFAIFASTGKQR